MLPEWLRGDVRLDLLTTYDDENIVPLRIKIAEVFTATYILINQHSQQYLASLQCTLHNKPHRRNL